MSLSRKNSLARAGSRALIPSYSSRVFDTSAENYNALHIPTTSNKLHLVFNVTAYDIFQKKREQVPIAKCVLHLPDGRKTDLEVFRFDKVIDVKKRIEEENGVNMKNYMLVGPTGEMHNEEDIESYYLLDGQHLILVLKGISTKAVLEGRQYWLKRREKRVLQNNPNNPSIVKPKVKKTSRSQKVYKRPFR